MICKKCGAKFEGNFCPKCGTPAEEALTVCPKCGQERGAGDRYCPKCGYDFARSDRKESVSFGAKAAEAVKKVPKKAWMAIAAIVLVVIVIIVLVSVLSNKFRLGVVEKIEIGDSRQSVIELLGDPYDYREGSSTFTYYSNNYLKLLEENDNFDPNDIQDWEDFENAFGEAVELEQKLQTEEYKYIEVRFDGEGRVESVFFDASRTEKTKGAAKAVKKYEVLERSGSEVTYSVRYQDGSYMLGIATGSLEPQENALFLEWHDRFGNEFKTKTDFEVGKGWYCDPQSSVLFITENEFSDLPDNFINVEIGSGVTSIRDRAFYDCDSLTSITIPDSVTSIGESAFAYCSSLTSVTIPDSVTSIGEYAFSGCDSLTSVTIPDSVTSIGDYAFYHCDSLTSITIPDSVTSIGDGAFYHCDSLTSITIPDSVTFIGDFAFHECNNLTSITIGDGVTSIGEYAFEGCSRLTSVYITNLATWCGIEFGNSGWRFSYSNPSYYAEKLYLNDVLVKDLMIPYGVSSIGDWAFAYFSSLTSITIPDSVTSIGDGAFFDCDSLESVTIPDSVTSIDYGAFHGCESLETVYYTGSEAEWNDIKIRAEKWANNEDLLNAEIVFNYTGE